MNRPSRWATLCLDGAYTRVNGQPHFQRVPPPTKAELDALLERITTRIGRHLERLCRYITRPTLATGRLALTPQGQVRYTLKTPYRDGTTHVVFEPLDFIARLAALVPRPRVHLTRYHGVFAPHSHWRAQITPAGQGSRKPATEHRSPAEKHRAMSWAQRLKQWDGRVFKLDLESFAGVSVRSPGSSRQPGVFFGLYSSILGYPLSTAREPRHASRSSLTSLHCESKHE